MSLTILQVIASAERRGAETFGVALGGALGHLGHQVETVAVEPGGAPVLDVELLGAERMRPDGLRRLRSKMRRADVVIAHGSTALPATAIAGLGCSTPVIYRQISDPTTWTATRLRRARVRIYLHEMDHVVALTDRTKSIVAERFGFRPADITVVPNGADADRFIPASPATRKAAREHLDLGPDDFVVAWVGALSAEKQPLLALRAIANLEGARLLMAGSGPLSDVVATEAPGGSILLGSVADPLEVYHAADVVLLTSRTESLPAVLIEAGLCGVPVVASDVGDVSSIVQHEKTGLLVTPDVAAMTSALEQLRDDPDRRLRLGEAARKEMVGQFSLSVVARRWESVASTVAAGQPR